MILNQQLTAKSQWLMANSKKTSPGAFFFVSGIASMRRVFVFVFFTQFHAGHVFVR